MTKTLPKLSYVVVPAASMQSKTPAFIRLLFQADFLMIPSLLVTTAGAVNSANGDSDATWGISINDPSAPELVFSLDKGYQGAMQVFEGQVTEFYIRQLSGAATLALTLLVGTDCDLGTIGAVEGAST